MSILCRFGFHNWAKWVWGTDAHLWQDRECICCGKAQRKAVRCEQ